MDHGIGGGEAESKAPSEPLRYLTLEFSERGIAELGGRRRMVFVARERIRDIELRRGMAGERPIAQVLFGGVLVIAGLFGLRAATAAFVALFERNSPSYSVTGSVVASLVVLVVGVYVLWLGLRPSYYLRIQLPRDERKVLLRGPVDLHTLLNVVRAAKGRYGYDVKWGVAEVGRGSGPYRSMG
jgi:hypothetical protein